MKEYGSLDEMSKDHTLHVDVKLEASNIYYEVYTNYLIVNGPVGNDREKLEELESAQLRKMNDFIRAIYGR